MKKLAVSFTLPIARLFFTLPGWQRDTGPGCLAGGHHFIHLRMGSFSPCKNGRETRGRNSSFYHLCVNIVCHRSKVERGMKSVAFQLNKKLFNAPLALSSPSPHALPPSFTRRGVLMGPAMVAHRLRGSASETTEVLVLFLAICNGCVIYKNNKKNSPWVVPARAPSCQRNCALLSGKDGCNKEHTYLHAR